MIDLEEAITSLQDYFTLVPGNNFVRIKPPMIDDGFYEMLCTVLVPEIYFERLLDSFVQCGLPRTPTDSVVYFWTKSQFNEASYHPLLQTFTALRNQGWDYRYRVETRGPSFEADLTGVFESRSFTPDSSLGHTPTFYSQDPSHQMMGWLQHYKIPRSRVFPAVDGKERVFLLVADLL